MKYLSFVLIFVLHFFYLSAQSPELIFYSGFESDTVVSIPGDLGEIIGANATRSDHMDWKKDLEAHPNIGHTVIVYTKGGNSMRLAQIVPSPTDETDRVLHSWIKYPDADNEKGRVEVSISEITGIKSLYSSQMMYLPADFNLVKELRYKVEWLSLMEYWNDPNWTNVPYPFRLTIGIENSPPSPEALHFSIHAQRMDNLEVIWESLNTSFSIPVGKWMKLESYFTEGDDTNGRYTLIVTPVGEDAITICDNADYTHHPDDPSPDGLSHFDVLKLYTSSRTVDSIRNKGGILNLFWDDLELWKDSSYMISNPIPTE